MDLDSYLRFVLALVFVLALIGGIAWALRRFGLGGLVATPRGAQRRLRLVEALAVDAKRRLILLQRDDVEHLVLLGPEGDLLIERGAPGGPVPRPAAVREDRP